MELDFNVELFTYAFEKNTDNELWEMWKLQFPNMDKETFVSFENYKANLTTRKHTEISYEDIEKEMELVEKAFKNE